MQNVLDRKKRKKERKKANLAHAHIDKSFETGLGVGGVRPGMEASVRGPSHQERCAPVAGASPLPPAAQAHGSKWRTPAQGSRTPSGRRAQVSHLPAPDAPPAPRPGGKGRLLAAGRLRRWRRSEDPAGRFQARSFSSSEQLGLHRRRGRHGETDSDFSRRIR